MYFQPFRTNPNSLCSGAEPYTPFRRICHAAGRGKVTKQSGIFHAPGLLRRCAPRNDAAGRNDGMGRDDAAYGLPVFYPNILLQGGDSLAGFGTPAFFAPSILFMFRIHNCRVCPASSFLSNHECSLSEPHTLPAGRLPVFCLNLLLQAGSGETVTLNNNYNGYSNIVF